MEGLTKVETIKKNLNRKIERCKTTVAYYKEKHGDDPSVDFNYHGGWVLGYWEGRLSALEHLLDDMEEL